MTSSEGPLILLTSNTAHNSFVRIFALRFALVFTGAFSVISPVSGGEMFGFRA